MTGAGSTLDTVNESGMCPPWDMLHDGTCSTTGQNHITHADRFVTIQQCQPHKHVLLLLTARTWITSQPWHQQHPTARNMIKPACWRGTQLVSQLSAIFYTLDCFFFFLFSLNKPKHSASLSSGQK